MEQVELGQEFYRLTSSPLTLQTPSFGTADWPANESAGMGDTRKIADKS
jgi:hypothetical protein